MRSAVLKRLASIWVAWSTGGLADPAAALAEVPEELVIDSVEDADTLPWQSDDFGALLQLIRQDPRIAVRSRIAELAGPLYAMAPSATRELIDALALDPSARVRIAASNGLARVLERASPADRIELVSSWATSPEPKHRAAIARALCASIPMFVTDLAIEQLACDDSAEVRRGALQAATAHFGEAPLLYAALAERSLGDSDEGVRNDAKRLLSRR